MGGPRRPRHRRSRGSYVQPIGVAQERIRRPPTSPRPIGGPSGSPAANKASVPTAVRARDASWSASDASAGNSRSRTSASAANRRGRRRRRGRFAIQPCGSRSRAVGRARPGRPRLAIARFAVLGGAPTPRVPGGDGVARQRYSGPVNAPKNRRPKMPPMKPSTRRATVRPGGGRDLEAASAPAVGVAKPTRSTATRGRTARRNPRHGGAGVRETAGARMASPLHPSTAPTGVRRSLEFALDGLQRRPGPQDLRIPLCAASWSRRRRPPTARRAG